MTIIPNHWVRESHAVAIGASSELEHKPSVAFLLGKAPDGLSLALHVERDIDVRDPVLMALRRPERLTPELERCLTELERAARTHALNLGLIKAGDLFYETAQSISMLLGQTLLGRMLGTASPMVLAEDVIRAATPSRFANTALAAIREDNDIPSAPAPTFGRDARLWIGLGKGAQILAVPDRSDESDESDESDKSGKSGKSGKSDRPKVTPEARRAEGRPVIFEDLLGIRSARWHIIEREGQEPKEGDLRDTKSYRRALQKAKRVSWSVSRADAARLVAELARSVDQGWHARKRVHGDLKPGNVLLQGAVTPFDALDVAEGEICAGVTEGWAAPEQIFVRPVSAATDVFALGLMAASALSASVYGEECSVVVPAAGQGRRRLRMIKNPDVWIDPSVMSLPTPARLAWRELLVRCLTSDPESRPRRGAELASRLDELLSNWELPGRLSVACGPGQAQLSVDDDPMWVLSEHR
jgi:hypothetical protein